LRLVLKRPNEVNAHRMGLPCDGQFRDVRDSERIALFGERLDLGVTGRKSDSGRLLLVNAVHGNHMSEKSSSRGLKIARPRESRRPFYVQLARDGETVER